MQFWYTHDYIVMFDELFQRSGLSLDRLRAFLRVADAGAIARAAPGNPIRQSQLSRQIGELEAFFGQALVERKGRGLVLTAPGHRLAVVVRESLRGLAEVAATSADQPVAASLGAGDSLLHGWILPRLPQLLDAAAVTLTLASMHGQEAAARLVDARLDLAVLRASEVAPGLRTRSLGTIEYALFVPRVLAGHRSERELLASVPLAVQYGDPEIAAAFDRFAHDAELAVTPALICETFPQAQRAVSTKRFAALLPTLARFDLPAREFLEVRLFVSPGHKVVLAWHPRLERQRPGVVAIVPALARAFALPARD